MIRRRGGLLVASSASESGFATLREALELFPGARIAVLASSVRAEDRHQYMRKAAYLVLPGLQYEEEPRELVEAFACGLPVIASGTGALARLVEPGRNGLLSQPGSVRELARRLAWAEAFPERMRQMGECAQADYHARLVANWGWQRLFGERRREARLS